eukprot:5679665-Ditylum_brightwellii.AAC.1
MTKSPSGKHLGHYKAVLARGPYDPKSEEVHAFWSQEDSLALINVDLINYALKHQYSYQCWKPIVNVILQRDKGHNKIHQICIVHIYKADYFAMTGIIWRNLIKSSEEGQTLNNGQVGGRAGCEANTLTLMEELETDISRCSQKALINFDNDAASCYDQIIPNLTNLIGRKKGLHHNITFVH